MREPTRTPSPGASATATGLDQHQFGESSSVGVLDHARDVLTSSGFSAHGVEQLNLDSMRSLIDLLSHGEKRAETVRKVFNAVAEGNSEKLSSVIEILSTYTGSFPILSQFLESIGYHDPFKATARAQLLILPADSLPTSRGVSGHVLTGLTYCAYAPDAPTDTVGYFSKKQAITKIFEAFNPQRMAIESQDKVRHRRVNALKEQLKDISLDQLEHSPEALRELGSPLLARNMEVYRELRDAIEQCHEHLSELVYGREIVISGLKSFKVSEDPGRQFYGWFEEHIRENKNVPRGIVIAFQSLRDPDIHLSIEEEKSYLRGLLSYQRVHSYINKKVALAGLQNDLAEYAALGTEDPLRLNDAVHQARIQIQETAREGTTEMTLADFSKMLELSGMLEFRRSMNRRIFSIYENEISKALNRFEFVSFDKGKWREDVIDDSVPMDRLKKHVYGAKIGTADGSRRDDHRQAVLGQRDYRAIIDYQFLSRLMLDTDKFLTALSVPDFRTMVHGIVVANRKAEYLDKKLCEYVMTPRGSALSLNRDDIGDTLADWKPQLLIGRFVPAEISVEESFGSGEEAIDFPEIAARTQARSFSLVGFTSQKRKLYERSQFAIEEGATMGLVTEDSAQFLRGISSSAMALVAAADHRDEMDRATRLFAHPLISSAGFSAAEVLKQRYLLPREYQSVKNFLTIEARIEESSKGHEGELAKIGVQLREYQWARFLVGSIKEANGVRRLALESAGFENFGRRETVEIEQQKISYFTYEEALKGVSAIEGKFVNLDTVQKEWFGRARTVCSSQGRRGLQRAGFSLVDNETFGNVRNIRAFSGAYISRDFVAKVDDIAALNS